jgi:hypothetical protein
MNEDLIEELFASTDEYYPGSKRKRKAPEVKVLAEVPTGWDSRPYIKTMPNGQDVEMFTIGALADALGRPIITLRAWMKDGYLPMSPYRLPSKVDKHGEMRQGRRLYTRPMIEAAIEVFNSSGLLGVNRVDWSVHQHVPQELAEAWDKIRAKEIKIEN